MQSNTHLSSSMSMSLLPFMLIPSLEFNMGLAPFYLSGAAIGSLFPDIDEPQSSIGRYVSRLFPFVPIGIKYLFGHRGITHRFIFFLFPLAILLIAKDSLENYQFTFLIAFLFGILLHQFGDMLSGSKRFKGGIKDYFYPFFTTKNEYFTPFPFFLRCAVWDLKEKIYNILFICLFIYEIKILLFPILFR